MKILLAQINPTVGDFEGNYQKMCSVLKAAKDADLIVFPECALCGYPQQDLLDYQDFGRLSEEYGQRIIQENPHQNFLFGLVERNVGQGKPFFNVAYFAEKGKKTAVYRKRLLPTYDVFDEDRFFESGREPLVISFMGEKLGITICEDIWNDEIGTSLQNRYQQFPLKDSEGATLFVNLSASPFESQKVEAKSRMLRGIAKRHKKRFIYVNSVGANDGIIFDGRSTVISSEGHVILQAKGYQEHLVLIETDEIDQKPPLPLEHQPIQDIYDALVLGIKDYCLKQNFETAILGLSGGIDSALVACLAMDALGTENVMLVLMPSRYTSPMSLEDGLSMARTSQCPVHLLPIEEIFKASLRTLGKAFEGLEKDVTEENLQSRSRAILLMGLSNKFKSLLLTTGNKSELAVGYCTLYGDMCGGLAPLSDVYKTQVYELSKEANRRWNRIPERVFTRAPSAELKENQADQDTLPPYERLDAILKAVIENFETADDLKKKGFDSAEIAKVLFWLSRSEYKRFQMPIGLKISSKAFGIGRRVPVVHRFYEQK